MSETREILTTCPRDCYDACGVRVVLRGDAIDRVTGAPDHPANRGSLCGKCTLAYNGAWRDPEQRLLTPLRRAGPKGEGRFEAIGWDEALDEIAGRLNGLIAADRAGDILTAHYTGTCSALANQFPMRFFNAIGATEVEPDTICNLSGHLALGYMLGDSTKGFDPRTAADSTCLIVWGANPSASGPHVDKHWLAEFPGKVIVIDPVRTPTASRADLHLRPFPGSDSALAFGLLHALQARGRFDRAFIDAHTLGADELAADIAAWTPARAAEATGIPEAQILAAADLYAAGPSMLWLGQALCRQPRGGNAFRAAALLPALTGQIGKPGTGLYFLNGKGATRGLDMGQIARADLRSAPTSPISHMDLCGHLEQAPRDKALILWNINIAASNPDQTRLWRALSEESLFTVVLDLFATDSTRFADIVLPAASFLEFDDLAGSYFHLSLGAQAKAVEPMGQSLPNQEIFRRLARHMGLSEPALFEDDGPILDALLAPHGLSFEDLKARGHFYPQDEAAVLWSDLSFPTPSGRIELASAQAEADGLPRTPQPDPDPRPQDDRLRLLSPASPWHMNSSYDNDEGIRRQAGRAEVVLHPADAAARGLATGDRVRLWNDAGALELTVNCSEDVPRGVALSPKGRWPRHEGDGNINRLNPGLRADMGDSTGLHGVEVFAAASGVSA